MKAFFGKINRWLEVPSSDPDDARRRKLLNIILVGVIILSPLMLAFTIWLWFTTPRDQWIAEVSSVFWASLAILGASIIIFNLNRRFSGWLASGTFLIVFTVTITFVDIPSELLNGRSLYLFTLPIIMAGVLMSSSAIFLAMGLSDLILIYLATQVPNGWVNLPGSFMTFAFIALLIWLSSRSVETSLRDLRKINANLDHLVQDRTKELASALGRERIDAGRNKAILESIADGVIVFDLNDTAIIANPSTERLLELPQKEIVGRSIEELSHSKALAETSREIMAGILKNPGAQSTSYHIDWSKKTFSVMSAPVNDTQGMLIGAVAVFRDYTHEAEVERMKNTFLAIVSHELRTPLNAILGYAEMIKEAIYGPVNEKQVKASDRIMTNSHRLLEIVSDLLDQAQMEAGKLALRVREFRPADLIENVHGVMDKIAADRGLIFSSELDPELPEFMNGDIARLQQILVNLSNNAIKFTEQGEIHISLKRAGKRNWSMEVRDSGIGIPESDLPTVFEAFRQVDSTITRKFGGFGLGLTIVKQLTELMGGNVVAKSKIGAGSNFIVTLPLKQSKRKIP